MIIKNAYRGKSIGKNILGLDLADITKTNAIFLILLRVRHDTHGDQSAVLKFNRIAAMNAQIGGTENSPAVKHGVGARGSGNGPSVVHR